MGKLVVSEFVTLDGVFEDPGGSEGKPYGGWQRPLMGPDEGEYKFAELQATDALLFGRVTFEGFAAYWPTAEDTGEFGKIVNALPKYVVTHNTADLTWNNSRQLEGDLETAVQKLKNELEKDILVWGSGWLVRILLEAGLVDELRLMTYPLVLGEGRRLFQGVTRTAFTLTESKTFASGTVVLTYAQTKTA